MACTRSFAHALVDPFAIPELPELAEDWRGFARMRDDFDAYLAQHPNAPYKSFKELVASNKYLRSRFAQASRDAAACDGRRSASAVGFRVGADLVANVDPSSPRVGSMHHAAAAGSTA